VALWLVFLRSAVIFYDKPVSESLLPDTEVGPANKITHSASICKSKKAALKPSDFRAAFGRGERVVIAA